MVHYLQLVGEPLDRISSEKAEWVDLKQSIDGADHRRAAHEPVRGRRDA